MGGGEPGAGLELLTFDGSRPRGAGSRRSHSGAGLELLTFRGVKPDQPTIIDCRQSSDARIGAQATRGTWPQSKQRLKPDASGRRFSFGMEPIKQHGGWVNLL